MALSSGFGRAHRLIQLTAGQDSSLLPIYTSNGFQPGWEARGFKSYTFQVSYTGTVPGTLSLLVYGTVDPLTARGSAVAPRWFILPANAAQTGAGVIANPVTVADGTQSMQYSAGNLEAWRIVANAFTGGGTINIDVEMVA